MWHHASRRKEASSFLAMNVKSGKARRELSPGEQISAKKGQGIDDLLETLLLVAEVEQLTANPPRMARYSSLSV